MCGDVANLPCVCWLGGTPVETVGRLVYHVVPVSYHKLLSSCGYASLSIVGFRYALECKRTKSRIKHKYWRASRNTIKMVATTMYRRRTPSFRAVFLRHPLFACADSIYVIHVVCIMHSVHTVVLNRTLDLLLLSYYCMCKYVAGKMYGAKKASSASVRSGSAAETAHPCLQWFLGY